MKKLFLLISLLSLTYMVETANQGRPRAEMGTVVVPVCLDCGQTFQSIDQYRDHQLETKCGVDVNQPRQPRVRKPTPAALAAQGDSMVPKTTPSAAGKKKKKSSVTSKRVQRKEKLQQAAERKALLKEADDFIADIANGTQELFEGAYATTLGSFNEDSAGVGAVDASVDTVSSPSNFSSVDFSDISDEVVPGDTDNPGILDLDDPQFDQSAIFLNPLANSADDIFFDPQLGDILGTFDVDDTESLAPLADMTDLHLCPHCAAAPMSQQDFEWHMVRNHPDEAKVFKCTHCNEDDFDDGVPSMNKKEITEHLWEEHGLL